jgi:hypothetical protein
LVDNRDAYVATARQASARLEPIDVYCSYNSADALTGTQLAELLRDRGLAVALTDPNAGASSVWPAELFANLDRSRNLVVIVGDHFSDRQNIEVSRFLQSLGRESADRGLFSVLLPKATFDDMPSLLRSFRSMSLDSSSLQEIADSITEAAAAQPDESLDVAADSPETLDAILYDFRNRYEA